MQEINIGEKTKTKTTICYLNDKADKNIVEKLKKRLKGENVEAIIDSGNVKKIIKGKRSTVDVGEITENTIIEPNIVCSEKHRAFFKEKIGKTFSFNVQFQKWLKGNAGKNYGDAIDAYHEILEEKKKGKTKIDKQFEYNTYIRDFIL